MPGRGAGGHPRGAGAATLRGEEGFALVGAVLVMVLVTGLASAALLYSQLDITVAGNYRVQRSAEVAAEGALELARAMIYGGEAPPAGLCAFTDVQLLPPPQSVPANLTTSVSSKAVCTYADADLDVQFTLQFKQEDEVNYNGAETYADEVVRYGQDYNYRDASKETGKQPIYTIAFVDNKTGTRGEADLTTPLVLKTPAALYVQGRIRIVKDEHANEERLEVTGSVDPGTGIVTPALATAEAQDASPLDGPNVFVQRAVETSQQGSKYSYKDQAGTSFSYNPDYTVDNSLCATATLPKGLVKIYTHPSPTSPYCPPTTLKIGSHPYSSATRCWKNVSSKVYTSYTDPAGAGRDVGGEIAAGRYNNARDRMHVLLGVGERSASLDGAGSYAASKEIFNFDPTDAVTDPAAPEDLPLTSPPTVVRYNYRVDGSIPSLEEMLGVTFAEFKSLADQVLTGDQTVQDADCNNVGGGKDVSGLTFGTSSDPQIVYFESNMNEDGSSNGHAPLVLVTSGEAAQGCGILVINGDATIYGRFNWTGLMVVRGKLTFYSWAGGTPDFPSALETEWKGWIMIGGDPSGANEYGLRLETYNGGGIVLGYSSSDAAAVQSALAAAVPHKVLSWRRSYQ